MANISQLFRGLLLILVVSSTGIVGHPWERLQLIADGLRLGEMSDEQQDYSSIEITLPQGVKSEISSSSDGHNRNLLTIQAPRKRNFADLDFSQLLLTRNNRQGLEGRLPKLTIKKIPVF